MSSLEIRNRRQKRKYRIKIDHGRNVGMKKMFSGFFLVRTNQSVLPGRAQHAGQKTKKEGNLGQQYQPLPVVEMSVPTVT
jgi:hypothetical protein